jgi:hypothetical protein
MLFEVGNDTADARYRYIEQFRGAGKSIELCDLGKHPHRVHDIHGTTPDVC